MLGLKELIRRSKPDECPFCGEPRALKPKSTDKYQISCGDEICKLAYIRYWRRDEQERLRKKREEQAEYAKTPKARSLQYERSKAWKKRNPERFAEQKKRYHQSEKGREMRARANKKYYEKRKAQRESVRV
jgi:hypothetical protein